MFFLCLQLFSYTPKDTYFPIILCTHIFFYFLPYSAFGHRSCELPCRFFMYSSFSIFTLNLLSSLQLQTSLSPYSLHVYYTLYIYDILIFLVSYNKPSLYNSPQEMPAPSTYYTTALYISYLFFTFILSGRCFTGYVLPFLALFTYFKLPIF